MTSKTDNKESSSKSDTHNQTWIHSKKNKIRILINGPKSVAVRTEESWHFLWTTICNFQKYDFLQLQVSLYYFTQNIIHSKVLKTTKRTNSQNLYR